MRTKTLLLSAALGALSSASLMAQVYSLNAVGYINVTCNPGFSMIANQLNTTNNFMSPLLDAQLAANPSFINCAIYKWTGSSFISWIITQKAVNNYSNGVAGAIPEAAQNGISATNTTLNPGEAIFFQNVNATNVTLTFVGTVLTGETTNTPANGLTNALEANGFVYPSGAVNSAGFNFVSSMVPVAGQVDTVLGVVPALGDTVYAWDTNLNAGAGGYDQYTWGKKGWIGEVVSPTSAATPIAAVGAGFFYQNTATTVNNWVENFAVSQ
jgi:hypothetical protein